MDADCLREIMDWHIAQAGINRHAASSERSVDDREYYLQKAIWHYDCVDLIKMAFQSSLTTV